MKEIIYGAVLLCLVVLSLYLLDSYVKLVEEHEALQFEMQGCPGFLPPEERYN